MNELEYKRYLEYKKIFHEDMVKFEKDSLFLNRFLFVSTVVIALLLIVVGVGYLKDGDWIYAILEFALAVMNVGLGINAARRIKPTKTRVECEKKELECINSEIQKLEKYLELMENEND